MCRPLTLAVSVLCRSLCRPRVLGSCRSACNEVMKMLWKRVGDLANWRHVYKVRERARAWQLVRARHRDRAETSGRPSCVRRASSCSSTSAARARTRSWPTRLSTCTTSTSSRATSTSTRMARTLAATVQSGCGARRVGAYSSNRAFLVLCSLRTACPAPCSLDPLPARLPRSLFACPAPCPLAPLPVRLPRSLLACPAPCSLDPLPALCSRGI